MFSNTHGWTPDLPALRDRRRAQQGDAHVIGLIAGARVQAMGRRVQRST